LVATTTGAEDWASTYEEALADFPNSPLINWFSTSTEDWSTYSNFATNFPANAASAYNMLAYAHAYGEMGDEGPNYDAAFASLDKLEKLHDGPNSYDSRAEIAAMKGDYEMALDNQLKAFDYATSSSPYQYNLPVYWRKANQSDVSDRLIEAQKAMQNAILEGDKEKFSTFVSDEIGMITGDSNLGDFYSYSVDNLSEERNFTWNAFDLRDFETHFSPDMRTVILTFYASGSYSFTDSNEEVAYSTRASSVWLATDNGWKCAHASWAPHKSGTGIPK
jgi:tetratricopeptide (TPR) repeat protein